MFFFSPPTDLAQKREWERRLRAIVATGGVRSLAAARLGMDATSLRTWCRRHEIPWPSDPGEPYRLTSAAVDAEVARWKAVREERDLARANRAADRVEAQERNKFTGRFRRIGKLAARGTMLVDPAWLERQMGGR